MSLVLMMIPSARTMEPKLSQVCRLHLLAARPLLQLLRILTIHLQPRPQLTTEAGTSHFVYEAARGPLGAAASVPRPYPLVISAVAANCRIWP